MTEQHNKLALAATADMVPAPITPLEMLDRAVSNGASIETLEKLMALQERWEANQGRKAFDAAISQAKAEIPPVIKSRTVDFTTQKGRTHYQYEDMAQIAKTVDPILSRHGLSYRYRTSQDGQIVTVTCILSHREGCSEETTLSSAIDQSGNKNHIQAIGSAATYLQRYTLKMALGIAASSDDDGKSSGQPERINADQFVSLQNLLEESGADEAKFCQFIGVDSLEEMPLSKLNEAMNALRKKIEHKGKA